MRVANHAPINPEGRIWDVVVIGTGAGGAPAGLKLARSGRSVLFVERGGVSGNNGAPAIAVHGGRVDYVDRPFDDTQAENEAGLTHEFVVGACVGGATSVFAMVMDRFRPLDFTPRQSISVPLGSSLPEAWPIQYQELERYYTEAEKLFRVRGTVDPLTPISGGIHDPLAPSPVETEIHDTLVRGGLHPYALHYARENVDGCDGCLGRFCDRQCRNDAGHICVVPAIENHGAHMLTNCLVTGLEVAGRKVKEATCLWEGRRIALRGKIFIVAMNALLTPVLLLRATSRQFSDGLGNGHGLVGRNLMAHVSDYLDVRFSGISGDLNFGMKNGLSLNDFYRWQGTKLGNVHAHAMSMSNFRYGRSSESGSGGTALFATIVEDFPYLENRIIQNGSSISDVSWTYRYPAELKERSRMLIHEFAAAIGPACDVSVIGRQGMLNASHMCGTCRSGDDPKTSVLDRNNRIHDVDNAYVVDASFFPSSGGINPSLTIVANSLRVSDVILQT